MKKILFILTLCLFFGDNAQATSFTEAIGGECARILVHLSYGAYPKYYDAISNRNKQFESLEKCLDLYYRAGGNIIDINKNFDDLTKIYIKDFDNSQQTKE